jgi:hypothetical protein
MVLYKNSDWRYIAATGPYPRAVFFSPGYVMSFNNYGHKNKLLYKCFSCIFTVSRRGNSYESSRNDHERITVYPFYHI